jgi:hypothetical protein
MDQQARQQETIADGVATTAGPTTVEVNVVSITALKPLTERAWNGATHILRLIGAFLVAYFFFFALTTSVVESNVVENLKSQGVQSSYAVALSQRQRIDITGPKSPVDQKIVDSFRDMEGLMTVAPGTMWLLGQFPPEILEIIFVFVSGLFGALLVTLVLIVYPNNQVLTLSDARPVTRTALGGLIALCIYIFLVSGTIVVGSGGSGAARPANNMTFCALGILAGMFSDRVAGWLSKRADQFFRQ